MKEETIYEQLDRFIGSIKDEIRSDEHDSVSIDFWLFKIEWRINILKKAIEFRDNAIEILNKK